MKVRSSCIINGFKYPASDQISGRTSTICRSMACTLLKREACSPEEEKKWKLFFPEKKCAYCGNKATHLDHLYPLIEDRKPTGYGTEAANLVPCCAACNQPKGNMHWEDFMRSDKCKHVGNTQTADVQKAMEERINVIKSFQKEMPPQKVDISDEIIKKWTALLSDFDQMLSNARLTLLDIKSQLYSETDKKVGNQ